MENRVLSIFLVMALLVVSSVKAQTVDENVDGKVEQNLIEPQIARAEFDESLIDTEDFEVTAYIGMLSVEDFGAQSVSGFKVAYHVSESFFVQTTIGESDAGKTSFEVLSGGAPLLSDEERSLKLYQFSLGYNLFPGEAYATDETTLNDIFYLTGGMGSTTFAGDDRSTISFGFGYRILFLDAFSLNFDLRDYVFSMDLFGEKKETHNLEYSLALGWYF
ncbi:MAG: outer membrane beta-barrel domain-containing protein [Gammaproteobacteria bacterium]|nr:outer membrane beta-barrel domain-containing protein [Gammaproteobacteria bacterium]